jgi:hypothetical protein
MDKTERDKIVIDICKFLKKHNALEKYCINVLSYHKRKLRVLMKSPLKERVKYIVDRQVSRVNEDYHPRLENFFQDCNTCFYWGETPEGVSFWLNLHAEWYKMVTGEDY